MAGSIAGLERALRGEGVGEVLFDAFARGRYATDASSYQITPLGVVIPGSIEEATRALSVARLRNVPVLPRGGGTSQSGQTVNAALVVDCSKRLTKILSLDTQGRRCRVEPGIVLDELNRRLKPKGLWFPVDISTASRATIGGMAGNNSCGGRSLRYGTMRDNVLSIDAVLADGSPAHFGAVQADLSDLAADDPRRALFADILRIGASEADEVAARLNILPNGATAMRHLAALETQGSLYFVAFAQEPNCLVLLGLIIVLIHGHGELDLLDHDHFLLFAGRAFALFLLVEEAAVVLNAADGRDSGW